MKLAERALLEADLQRLSQIHRPSASDGEAEAAFLLASSFRETGARVNLERDNVVGNYWLPLGLLSAAGIVAGALASRKRARPLAALLGAAAAHAVWGDITAQQRWIRKLLPKRKTTNVLSWFGPDDAEHTIVLVAHHDAAKSGLIFSPAIPELAWRVAPEFMANNEDGPPVMLPVILGPALAALAAAAGSRKLGKIAAALSALSTAAFADIASRQAVEGANDNATGVVTLQAVARRLAAAPLSGRTRILLLSTGSEESLLEGMGTFAKRWFPHLDPKSTFFLGVDTVGSGELCVLHGEGMLRMREYPQHAVQLVESEGDRLGIPLVKGLKHRNSTDALYPLQAGYMTAMLGSVNEYRLPSNYHWKTDVIENVDVTCLINAVELCESVIRRLDKQWLD